MANLKSKFVAVRYAYEGVDHAQAMAVRKLLSSEGGRDNVFAVMAIVRYDACSGRLDVSADLQHATSQAEVEDALNRILKPTVLTPSR